MNTFLAEIEILQLSAKNRLPEVCSGRRRLIVLLQCVLMRCNYELFDAHAPLRLFAVAHASLRLVACCVADASAHLAAR